MNLETHRHGLVERAFFRLIGIIPEVSGVIVFVAELEVRTAQLKSRKVVGGGRRR